MLCQMPCMSAIGKAIAGTTDSPIELTHLPTPREEDIRFILEEIKHYLSPDISGKIDNTIIHIILFANISL